MSPSPVGSGVASQGLDFGALLVTAQPVAQPVIGPLVPPAVGVSPQPVVKAADPDIALKSVKSPEAVAVQNMPAPAKPALPPSQMPAVAALPEQKQVEAPQPVQADKAATEIAPVVEPRTEILEAAPQIFAPQPVAPPPQALPVMQQQAQPKSALAAKAQPDEAIKIAVPIDAKPPFLLEQAAPAAATPFADVAAVFAKVDRVDPVAQMTERVLDVARGNAWLDQLASDIIAAQDDSRDLSFRLMPPQLGQLDVRIEAQDAGLELTFAAQTEEAAQFVAAAQPRLVEELRGQGVRVAGSEVSTSTGQGSAGGQPQRQNHPEQPQTSHRHFKHTERTAQNGRFA